MNHNAPSGPVVIAHGDETPVPVYVVRVPSVAIRPIESPRKLVNHNAPSGPVVMSHAYEML